LNVRLDTECACCSKPLTLHIDSEMKVHIHQTDAAPLVFVPDVDFANLQDPSIIDAF